MFPFNLEDAGGVVTALLIYGGLVVVAAWLAMIVWAYRDMRARSRDGLAQIFVALMVAVLTVPGVLIYLFLRPRETLAEAYERSLEEEALLQEIEDKAQCPGCKQRVREEWQACPYCHTRLKRPCTRCGRMLELSWDICPYCTTAVAGYGAEQRPAERERAMVVPRRQRDAQPRPTEQEWTPTTTTYRQGESLEFVDGDDT